MEDTPTDVRVYRDEKKYQPQNILWLNKKKKILELTKEKYPRVKRLMKQCVWVTQV